MDRRGFFKTGFRDYLRELVREADITLFETEERKKKDYFESVFSCYPLLSESPYDQLVKAARDLGISTENKSKLELAREIFGERK